jgi:hypothetical protein
MSGLNLEGWAFQDSAQVLSGWEHAAHPMFGDGGGGLHEVTAAYMNAAGQVTGLDPSMTYYAFLLRAPQTDGESTNIRFTGNPLSLSVANGTMTAHNYAAGTATIQANAGLVAPSTDKIILYFLPSSSAPVRLLPTITGTSADFNPNFLTHMGQLLGNGGGIRILDWNGGSLNSGVIDGDDNPFPTAVTTAANRNKLSSDDWLPQDGRDQFNASSGTRVNDGIPKEFCAMVANQIGAGYLHDNLTTNGDTTYYQAVAGIMANGVTGAPLPDGTTLNVAALTGDYVMELANEVGWNFNGAFWRSTVQFAREASESLLPPMSGTTFLFTASMAPDGATNSSILTVTGSPSGTITKDQYIGGVGVKGSTKIIATHADDATLTGTGGAGTYRVRNGVPSPQTLTSRSMRFNCGQVMERYAQRMIEIIEIMQPVFDAAGKSSKFQPVISLQNAGMARSAGPLLDYAPPGKSALKTYIKGAVTGNYFCDLGTSGFPFDASYVGPVQALIDAAYTSAEWSVDGVVQLWAACTSRGLWAGIYESGLHILLSNMSKQLEFIQHAEQYTLEMWRRFLLDTLTSGTRDNLYKDIDSVNPGGSPWGLMQSSNSVISLGAWPRAKAVVDWNDDIRTIFTPLYDTQHVSQGSANGSTLGSAPTRTISGSSYAITGSNPYGLSVNSSTGQLSVPLTATLTTQGSFTINVQITNAAASNSPKTVSVPYTVGPVLNNNHAYRYYRILTSAVQVQDGSGIYFQELEIMAYPAGPDTTSGKTLSASSLSGFGPLSGLTDDSGTYFATDPSSANYPVEWAQVDYGASSAGWIAANQFTITAAIAAHTASAFKFQGSDNGSSWTDLKSVSGLTWTNGEKKTWTI